MDERSLSNASTPGARSERTRWDDSKGSTDSRVAGVYAGPHWRRSSDFPSQPQGTRCNRVLLLPVRRSRRGETVGESKQPRVRVPAPKSARAFYVWTGIGFVVSWIIQLRYS